MLRRDSGKATAMAGPSCAALIAANYAANARRITARSRGKGQRKKGTVPSTQLEVGLLAEVV
jgi:hypothetical protein